MKGLRSFLHMLRLSQSEAEVYCREKRWERYEAYGGRVRFLRLHTLAHRVLLPLMRAELYLGGKRLTILRDASRPTRRPVIYCPTHIGGVDVEMSFVAARLPCWLMLGDPRELYKGFSGFMLQMSGLIPLDTLVKSDRLAARAQMKALLDAGGRLLIFPEGVQNISENALVNHLYAGAVEHAIICGAEIIPLALVREGNAYYCVVGENIRYEGHTHEERFALTTALRDSMASLVWEILEQRPALRRQEVTQQDRQDFLRQVVETDADYSWTIEDAIRTQFHPKSITEPAEAFAHLAAIEPSHNTSFLFNKRLRGTPKAFPFGGSSAR